MGTDLPIVGSWIWGTGKKTDIDPGARNDVHISLNLALVGQNSCGWRPRTDLQISRPPDHKTSNLKNDLYGPMT